MNRKSIGTKRRAKRDDFFEEEEEEDVNGDAGFLDSDSDRHDEDLEEEEEEDVETAEEKRLRLAKQYLDRIQQFHEDDEQGMEDALKQDALESMGHFRRLVADKIVVPEAPIVSEYNWKEGSGTMYRGHKLPVTAIALTSNDATVYSVSKDGSIMELDVESGARQKFSAENTSVSHGHGGAPWMTPTARQGSKTSLLAAAVSSDGMYLAVGGGDKKVHIWDTRSRTLLKSFPGHKDAISALSFRHGTHQLFSASLDRAVNIWSLEDMAYVDTLFGHQSPILGLDSLQGDRALTCGADRTCRIWKIPEESQLVFRGNWVNIESCAYVTQGEWVTGDGQGSVQLWNTTKKKPTYTCRNAHISDAIPGDSVDYRGAGSIGGDVCSWVGSVAVSHGSDLVASGAGDGLIKLWKVWDGGKGDGGRRALEHIGSIPARGFVNSLAIAKSATFVVAGMGQEPRMGRWLRDPKAQNGIFIHPLDTEEDSSE
jgi:ribosomal RNA-processing protein 9